MDKWNEMKVSELRSIAKQRKLKGYSKMKKNDLILLLYQPIINILDESLFQ
jgi:transcription termination factor Rho